MPYPDLTHPTIAAQDRRYRMAKGLVMTRSEIDARDANLIRDYQRRGIGRRELAEAYDLTFARITQILQSHNIFIDRTRALPTRQPTGGTDRAERLSLEAANKAFLKRLFAAHIRADTLPPAMAARDFIDRCHSLGMTVAIRPAQAATA